MSAPAPPSRIGLGTRFVLAGALLLATTVAAGAFTAVTLFRLSRVVGAGLRDNETTTAEVVAVTTGLEREDDALLVAITNPAAHMRVERARVEAAFDRLDRLLTTVPERLSRDLLRDDIDSYHRAADALVATESGTRALERYHRDVNPLLRRAVGTAEQVRDQQTLETRHVAAFTRDAAARSGIVAGAICIVAVLLSGLVAFHLGRVVLRPVNELTLSVDALTRGDFDKRVIVRSSDELGRLGEGFNRMADALAAFRSSSLGELMRANGTLEATLAALPDAVLVIDADGSVSSHNAEARAWWPKMAQPSVKASELPLPATAKSALAASLSGRGSAPGAIELSQAFSLADGKRKLLPRVVPFADTERRGAVLVLYDVTELARLDEMRMELVGVASHELRTPLTTLRMTLTMLREEANDRQSARQRELIATALGGVEQLAGTVDEFLDLTRIEAGQLRLNVEMVDLARVVAQEAERFRPQCEEANVGLTMTIEPGVRTRLDPARMAVVLGNVLGNAGKYTPPGGRIVVECRRAPVAGYALVSVTDSGSGVPLELRERIFEKFFRVEHERGGDGTRGAGIGLYLCRQIVEAHGGRIRCDAGPGGAGACLSLELPLA